MKSNNFIQIRYYLLIVIALQLSSCHNKKGKINCLNQVEFIFTLRNSIPLKYVGGINYKKFSFYKNETLNLKDSIGMKTTSLDIYIPENYTSFSLDSKSKCKYIYTYQNSKNDFISDTIRSGIVRGTLIDRNLWKIKINIKELNFEGVISSNEKYNGFRINSKMPLDLE